MVDEELLKSTLQVADRAGIHNLLGRSLDLAGRCRWHDHFLENGAELWLFLNRADWAWLFVLHGGGLWNDWCLVLYRNSDSKLELCLRSTIELLVDGGIGRIESDKGGGTVGVALKDHLGRGWDSKEISELRDEALAGEVRGEDEDIALKDSAGSAGVHDGGW